MYGHAAKERKRIMFLKKAIESLEIEKILKSTRKNLKQSKENPK